MECNEVEDSMKVACMERIVFCFIAFMNDLIDKQLLTTSTCLNWVQVVDMRWGVRDEATDDHMTTELCMKEIENCQRLSMGPNFVVFLGQKYGYRPIPTYILSSELQMLRDELTTMGIDGILLDTWYKKDSNAVPPISVLQPISSILINFNNKVNQINNYILPSMTHMIFVLQRVPKLQAEDQAIWWDILNKMQKLLRKAAASLFTTNQFSKEIMHNYFMSGNSN